MNLTNRPGCAVSHLSEGFNNTALMAIEMLKGILKADNCHRLRIKMCLVTPSFPSETSECSERWATALLSDIFTPTPKRSNLCSKCLSETQLSSRGVMRCVLHISKVLLLGYRTRTHARTHWGPCLIREKLHCFSTIT